MDLEVKKGDFVAVLSKTDPAGHPSEWWRCRARDGKQGYLPSPYLEPIQRPAQRAAPQITDGVVAASSAPSSRTATMKGIPPATKMLEGADRTKSLNSIYAGASGMNPGPAVAVPAKPDKPADISPESFQKSAFYS